jgi:osmoprotectant transport system permease protein
VWVIGTTTLATPVGATSLGNYIFGGLQTQNTVAVLVGCIAAALLAIILDQLIRLMEVAAEKRSGKLALIGGVLILALVGGGLAPMLIEARDTDSRPKVVIGAKTFTEQFILSDLIVEQLRKKGFDPEVRSSLGSIVLYEALANGSVDIYVDYTGTIWANAMKRDTILSGDETYLEMKRWLADRRGIYTVGKLGFENAYALAMTEEKSKRLGIETISQMVLHAESLSIGSDYEFFARPEWKSLQRIYGITFGEQRAFDPSLMYRAVREGEVDLITAFTTDGRIIAYNLAVIDDDRNAFPPYDAVLLMSPQAAQRPDLIEALGPLINSISDRAMRRANKIVDVDGRPVDEAVQYLGSQMAK